MNTADAIDCLKNSVHVDSEYLNGWHDNLACAAIDEGVDSQTAQRIAQRFLYNLFEVKSPSPEERSASVVNRYLEAKALFKTPNRVKGIDRSVLKTTVETKEEGASKDVEPKEVFTQKPKNVAVRSFAESGKDMSKAINIQIPKDKGYDAASNLSQYLVETKQK